MWAKPIQYLSNISVQPIYWIIYRLYVGISNNFSVLRARSTSFSYSRVASPTITTKPRKNGVLVRFRDTIVLLFWPMYYFTLDPVHRTSTINVWMAWLLSVPSVKILYRSRAEVFIIMIKLMRCPTMNVVILARYRYSTTVLGSGSLTMSAATHWCLSRAWALLLVVNRIHAYRETLL